MADRFEQFRLSLLMRPERSLFAGPDPTREEYLRSVLGEDRVFEHYGNTFHYKAQSDLAGAALLGRIGRRVEMEENLSPAQGLVEAVHETWKAAVLVVDPTDHVDGQKAALEIDRQVGGPLALLTALSDSINSAHPDAPYHIEVNPIFDASSFWTWAAEHEGQVTEVVFDLIAPNGLFNTRNSIRDEMKSAREQTGANEVTIGLKSSDSIDVHSPPVIEAVEYTVSSGGKIRGKAKNGDKFNSKHRPKTTSIPSDDIEGGPLIVRAARKIAEILGR